MSSAQSAAKIHDVPKLVPGSTLWIRQFTAIWKIETVKTLFSKRAFTCYGLAIIPVLLLTLAAFEVNDDGLPAFQNIERARQIFAQQFSALMLTAVIFLGSALIFTSLFRGEILDRSIHYYLLTPVKREILVLAKFAAGLSSAFLLFGLSSTICFLALYIPFGFEQLISDLSSGIALQQIGQYLGVTFLACMGYGTLFMATGLLFRNPLVPVIVIAGWELIHFILPPALKMISIIFYLKGLLPIPLDEGPLAVLVAPPSVWVSIFGMFALCAVTISISIYILKRFDVHYTDE